MKTASGKVKGDENVSNTATKTKTTSKVFAATTSTNQTNAQVKSKPGNMPPNCVACKEKHPLWRCPVFRNKTPTERAKLVADNKLCFSCFRANHSFKQCPSPANALKKVVKAPTTYFFTVPNEFFRKNPRHRIERSLKLRPVLEQQRRTTTLQRAQECLQL